MLITEQQLILIYPGQERGSAALHPPEQGDNGGGRWRDSRRERRTGDNRLSAGG